MAAIAMAFISLVIPMDDEATYCSSDRIYHVVQLGLRRRAGERPSFSHRCHYTHVSLSLAPPYDIAPSRCAMPRHSAWRRYHYSWYIHILYESVTFMSLPISIIIVERALTIIIEKVFSIINTVSCAITWNMIF